MVDGTELTVTLLGGSPEDRAVGCGADGLGGEAVWVAGVSTGLACGQMTSLRVIGSAFTDQISIIGIDWFDGTIAFPALTSLSVDAGAGNDVVRARVAAPVSVVELGQGDDVLQSGDIGGSMPLDVRGGDGHDLYLFYVSLGRVVVTDDALDRKSTRLNSSHLKLSRMPSSA